MQLIACQMILFARDGGINYRPPAEYQVGCGPYQPLRHAALIGEFVNANVIKNMR